MVTKRQAKYLAFTDFDLIAKCLASNLSPIQCSIIQFLNFCLIHQISDISLGESAEWLGLETYEVELQIKALQCRGIIQGVLFQSIEDQS